jgi:hypothetical protein
MDSPRKQQIRMRIGRSRRQIDRRLRAVQAEVKTLLSWQTYVRRYPLAAVTAALGAGMAAATALGSSRIPKKLGGKILHQALRYGGGALAKEILRRFRSGGKGP